MAKVKEETGLHLWVVTIADSSRKAAEFAESAWKATGLGASDVILVINVPDSGSNSFLFRADPSGVLSQGDQVSIADSLKPYLKKKDFNKAVAALPSLIKTRVAGAGTTGDRGATRSTSGLGRPQHQFDGLGPGRGHRTTCRRGCGRSRGLVDPEAASSEGRPRRRHRRPHAEEH